MENTKDYYECQQFRQWWMWLILIIIELSVLFFTFKIFTGTTEIMRPVTILTALLVMFIPTLIIIFIFLLRLETKITAAGISTRFFPIFPNYKLFPWIEDAYIRSYKPIKEFGGYGMRYHITDRSRAFNIRGNFGIQLVFLDGTKLLIGTQHPDAAQKAVEQYFLEKNAV